MRKAPLAILFMITFLSCFSQNQADKNIRVFIDCSNTWCDFSFIKTEINYVDFAPDRFTSNVYIMITSQQTGSGGSDMKLYFSGQENFKGMEDTLQFVRSSVATDDEYRKQLVQYLKLGLTRFVARSPLAEKMTIAATDTGDEPLNATANKKDPWNFWVMNASISGNFEKDDYSKSYSYYTSFDASRTTEKLKVNNGVYFNKMERTITIGNDRNIYPNKSYGAYQNTVISITNHWSYGGGVSYEYSTFNNFKSNIEVAPAIEYSLFPYKDAVKKAITIYYEAGPTWNQYIDTSYYNKLKEQYIQQSLSLNFGFIQKWGNINASAAWETFLSSFETAGKKIKGTDINSLAFRTNFDLRLVKGLFFNVYFSSKFTKGIFPNLRKSDFNADDILANVRQYPTTNNIYLFFGLRYRFGSVYNNVVNPRFNRDNF